MDDLTRVFSAVADYFTLLSEPMRIRIVHAICQQEKTVSQIVAETGSTQTNISRHLGSMHRAGVLTRRKEGNYIYYGVGDETLTAICRSVCVHIASRLESEVAGQSDFITLARELTGSDRPGDRARPGGDGASPGHSASRGT
ncbi:MAG: metalloregulator ArsR/SmtB family transcription factor [Pseudomonadota bacterium]|nr:metalloregulator ArsR/SmtB family transcription factor [Pseudomonadota bacterium]